jgi:DNA-binding PadR family transcriptional regulator
MTDHDRNGERAVEEIKRFSEGKSKPDPKEVYKILQKYEKLGQYSGYTGCF